MRAVVKDVISAAFLGAIGDISTQLFIDRREKFDTVRFFSVTSFNAIYIGGFLHVLYKALPPVVIYIGHWAKSNALQKKSTFAHSMSCALVDNIVNGLIYIPSYFIAIDLAERHSFSDAWTHLKIEWFTTYLSCSTSTLRTISKVSPGVFWIPYSAFNFKIVSPSQRVRFMAAGNLVWSVFVDWIAHRNQQDASAAAPHYPSENNIQDDQQSISRQTSH